LLVDIDTAALLAEGGTLATKGVGGEMTRCLALAPAFIALPPFALGR
jgi:hypothetical protein